MRSAPIAYCRAVRAVREELSCIASLIHIIAERIIKRIYFVGIFYYHRAVIKRAGTAYFSNIFFVE